MTPATSTTKSLRPGASLFDDRWTAPNQPVPMLACRVADKTKAVAALNNAHSQALGAVFAAEVRMQEYLFIETELP